MCILKFALQGEGARDLGLQFHQISFVGNLLDLFEDLSKVRFCFGGLVEVPPRVEIRKGVVMHIQLRLNVPQDARAG